MIFRFKKTASVIFILLVFLALLIAVQTYGEQNLKEDEHGCLTSAGYSWDEEKNNCVKKGLENSSEDYYQKIYCSEESRNVDACTFDYNPVCGFPSKKTHGNSCSACSDPSVEYFIRGECESL